MRPNELPPGTILGGDFCIERKLAEGGMGTVYVATQRSTGQRRAVKVFSAEVAVDDDLRARFVQESRIGARIASEHIATVIAAGFASHLPWLAMELLDGETLTDRVSRVGPLGAEMARGFFGQLGHALVEAHRAGVAHRDLKPDNIFIARSQRAGSEFTVKVLDFGIAKVHDGLSRQTTSYTFGTPLWMAPEQMIPGAAGFASDVWALGLIAFFALTGRVYWSGANATPFDAGALAEERLSPVRVPASVRSVQLLGRDVLPRGFDAWFAGCVTMQASARTTTITQALAGLDALLTGAPNPASARSPPLAAARALAPTELIHVAPKAAPKRARDWSVVGGFVLLALVGAGVVWWPTISRGDLQTHLRAPTETDPVPTERYPAPAPRPTAPAPGPSQADMVYIQGAWVMLNDRTRYDVPSFWIDRHEVTVSAYAQCVRAGRCPSNTRWLHAGPLSNVCNAQLPGRDDHPINCASLDEARAFCAWRGGRLPRNSEWELAVEGAAPRTWPWGEDPADASRLNACGLECPAREGTALRYAETDPWPTTAPVGSSPAGATPEGVMDLAGNVSEWVDNDQVDSQGRATVRGGGFLDGPTPSTRATRRVAVGYVGRTIGFRCAR